jgi:hypothetical protein
MIFKSTKFGSVTINNKKYFCDIFVFPEGKIVRRRRRIGPFGSHSFTTEEIKLIIDRKPDFLVVGTGQFGVTLRIGNRHYFSAHLSERARKLCESLRIKVIEEKTPIAIKKFNELPGRKAALIHVAC